MRTGLGKCVSHVCMRECAAAFNGDTPVPVWMCILDGGYIGKGQLRRARRPCSLLNHHLNLKASFGSPLRSSCDTNGLTLYRDARNAQIISGDLKVDMHQLLLWINNMLYYFPARRSFNLLINSFFVKYVALSERRKDSIVSFVSQHFSWHIGAI